MKDTHISEAGIKIIKEFEGFSAKPYLCPAKVPTVGIGTTRYPDGSHVKLTDREISLTEAVSFLHSELLDIEREVCSFVVSELAQHQFDALISFAYNCGHNALRKSTLLKRINANPKDKKIREEWMKWVYANGQVLKGLVKRRKAEADLYFAPTK